MHSSLTHVVRTADADRRSSREHVPNGNSIDRFWAKRRAKKAAEAKPATETVGVVALRGGKLVREEEPSMIDFVAAQPVAAKNGPRIRVLDLTVAPAAETPVAKPVRAAKLPQFLDEDDASLEAAPAPVVEPAVVVVPEPVRVPVAVHGVTSRGGKYAHVAPTPRMVAPAITGAALVQAAPAPKAAAKPAAKPAGFSMSETEAAAVGRGERIISCSGQKKRGGKLVPCGCSGFANTMVAPSVENLKRLHFGNPRPEDVLAQARCRASSLVDTRGFRWFPMLEVEERVTSAAAEYDRSLMEDGRIGRILTRR